MAKDFDFLNLPDDDSSEATPGFAPDDYVATWGFTNDSAVATRGPSYDRAEFRDAIREALDYLDISRAEDAPVAAPTPDVPFWRALGSSFFRRFFG